MMRPQHSWQRRHDPASTTDDWLMTYADMITLLLCFFAIFLSVTIPKKDAEQKLHLPHIVETPPPEAIKADLPFYGLPRIAEKTEADDVPEQPDGKPKKFPDSVTPLTKTPQPRTDSKTEHGTDEVVSDIVAIPPADRTYAWMYDVAQNVALNASVRQEGKQITTLHMSSGAFFPVGSATLSDSGKSILRGIASNIAQPRYDGYKMTVEGHTDDSPIDTPQFPSNWELSGARAGAVVRYLIEQGVDAKRLRATGYADTVPLVPNRDLRGEPLPENQAKNRRVVIKMEKIPG